MVQFKETTKQLQKHTRSLFSNVSIVSIDWLFRCGLDAIITNNNFENY